MKKYSWIIALLIALSLAFFACDFGTEEDDDDGDGDEDYDVLVLFSDGKFFERHDDGDLGSTGAILLNAAELTGGASHFELKKAIMLKKTGSDFTGGMDLRVDESIKDAKFLVIKWGFDSSDYLSDYGLTGNYKFTLKNDTHDGTAHTPPDATGNHNGEDVYGEDHDSNPDDDNNKDLDGDTIVIALGGDNFDKLHNKLISIDFQFEDLQQAGEDVSVKRVYFFDVRLVSGLPPEKKPGLKPKE